MAPKRAFCRLFKTPKGCHFGDKCRFEHSEQAPNGSKSATQRGVRTVLNDPLTRWKFMIPKETDKSTTLLGRDLAAFFQQAYELVDSGIAASQEVIQRLSSTGGLHRIYELCERAIDLSPEAVFLHEVLPFFKILAHHDVINSPSLDDYLRTIYAFIGHNTVRFGDLFDLFVDQIKLGQGQDGATRPEAELITISTTVLSKLLDHSVDAAVNDKVKDIASSLAILFHAAEIDGAMQAEVVRRLRRIDRRLRLGLVFTEVTSQSLKPAEQPRFVVRKEPPGGRHDNDYEDISEISILPTIAEIQSIRIEYLPPADPDAWHTAPDQGLVGLLDRQFRLLREDSVGPLRDAIRETLETICGGTYQAPSEFQRAARTLRYSNVMVRNVEIDTHICGPVFTVSFETPKQLPAMRLSGDDRTSWWFKSGRLAAEALVCLIDPQGVGNVVFCTVLRQLSSRGQSLENGKEPATFHYPHDSEEAHIRLALAAADSRGSSFMFENFTSGFASRFYTLVEFPKVLLPSFEPVLRAIQSTYKSGDLPLSDILAPPVAPTILHEIELPAYARKPGFRFRLSSVLNGAELHLDPKEPFDLATFQEQSSLDTAQAQAVVAALTRQLALIQGPPGTGKSYCGVQLTKILLDNKGRECMLGPILVVCYTNHALDQLLEHLLDAGIEQVIRIGSRSKSERLQAVNLHEVAFDQGERTKVEKSIIWELTQKLETLKTQLESIVEKIAASTQWESVKNLAETSFPGLIKHIDGLPDEEGFQVVQKRSSPQQRFQQWLRANRGPISDRRQAAYLAWIDEVKEPLLQQFHELQDDFTEIQTQIKRQRLGERLRILQQADIVGVTSSGLARHLDLLRNLQSKVILIEEAGELLEAHTLTSLLPSIEHAILIGDHLQLRPHLLNHDLSCESMRGAQYSFDVSLFERLVNPVDGIRANKVPFSTLEIQRRMHPSISALIRDELYPSLQDFPTVMNYPQVHGIKHRLFWIDHKEPEADADEHLSTSHHNTYEVEMTLALVSHLIKQGQYNSAESIAVITPYLGQLRQLREKMKSQYEIVVLIATKMTFCNTAWQMRLYLSRPRRSPAC